MAKLFNRAKMTTTTTGTGTITLGSASNGFQSFADAGVANGDVVQYVIEEGANFEIGTGTYTSSGTTLTRSPTESSNSDAAITLAGQATVSITATHADFNRLQHNGSDKVTVSSTGASVTGNISVTGTVDGRDVATDGSKLDGIESGATADQTAAQIRAKVEAASDSNVFTDADHTKLNGIATNANNYSLPLSSSSARGGVKIGYAENGKNYPVELSSEKMFVNVPWTDTTPNNATITISAGTDLTTGGNFTTNQGSNETITINHADTSTLSGTYGSTANGTKIDQITVDARGHVTAITTGATGTGSMSSFQLEDGDGTEVTINNGKEVKFVEGGGIDINWTDTSTGSDGDPYDLTFTHADTSSQASVNNSGNTVIQDVTLDTYGHVTGLTSKSLSIPAAANNATITLSAGTGLSGGGNFTTNQSSNETITFNLEAPYTYIDTATGNYGTVKVDDDRGVSWAGYAIRDDWVFMSDGANNAGLYNDTDNEWAWLARRNAEVEFYHNGSLKFETSSNGIEMSGRIDMNNNDIYGCDQLFHHGDTNTYMQFHAADQWRVVVGGSERLEVKNSSPHVLVTGDLNSTSDARLKENVEPIANALSDIAQLEGVSFDWRDTGTRGHGFIAQQVEPILPNVVQTDDETGIKSINYVGMIGHLVEAIKELKAEIEELKRQ